MLLHTRPSARLGSGQKALLLGLCLLSLAAPMLVEQPDWLAQAHGSQAEITALEAHGHEESDNFLLNSCWLPARQPGIVGRGPADSSLLAHRPTLRPATPPPEISIQA